MANTDSRSMDELEEKKWLISRIDLFHKTMIEALQNDVKRYEGEGDKALSKIRGYRNNILSVLGIFLTIILGTISVYHIEQGILFIILIVLGVVSLIVTIIFNKLIELIEGIVASFNEIHTENIGMLAQSLGFIITSVAELSKVTLQFTYNYYIFTMLLDYAIMISTSKSLKRLAKNYSFLSEFKNNLIKEAKDYEKYIEFIPIYYQKLDPSQGVMPELMQFIDKTLANYRDKK